MPVQTNSCCPERAPDVENPAALPVRQCASLAETNAGLPAIDVRGLRYPSQSATHLCRLFAGFGHTGGHKFNQYAIKQAAHDAGRIMVEAEALAYGNENVIDKIA